MEVWNQQPREHLRFILSPGKVTRNHFDSFSRMAHPGERELKGYQRSLVSVLVR